MKKDKNSILIVISFMVPLLMILSISLIDQIEKKNLIYSYDFEDDEIGDYPDGFVGVLRDIDYTRVIYLDEIYGQVAEVRYLTENIIGLLGEYPGVEFNTLFKLSSKGVIEFDIYSLHNKKINIDICQTDGEYNIRDDIAIRMPISTLDYNIAIRNGDGIYEKVKLFSTQVWYHFKIEFDIETGWKLWINNDLIQFNQFLFEEEPPYFCQLYFATYSLGNVFYVDNIKITLSQPADPIYPLDVYIPIIIVIFLSTIILLCYFNSVKLKRTTTTKRFN